MALHGLVRVERWPTRVRMVAWLFGIAATLAVFCANRVAHADWPSARHDLSRTGMASGTSNMTKPIPYWRQFMGSALGTGGVVVADLDGDGANELAYVAGGRAVARKVDGTTIWTSPLNALTQIVGAFDLDGNGSLEVIATSVDRVFVYSGTTGDLLWAETQGEMGAIGLVRVADFTHDGAADILVVECGCCSVTSGNTGFLYSFATGFANPQRLWSLPSIGCGSGWSTTAFDPDGTGTLFAFQGAANQASVLNGATGAVLATVTGLPAQAQAMQCLATDVDGLPGEELVCLLNWTVAAPNGHQAYVFKYATSTQTLSLLWSATIGEKDGVLIGQADSVNDLDGNGTNELVLGGQTAANADFTSVYDATTGAELDRIDGERFAGILRSPNAGGTLVLTTSNNSVNAWAYSPNVNPPLAYRWSLVDRGPMGWSDWTKYARFTLSGRLISLDLNRDGEPEYLGQRTYAGSEIDAYDVSSGSPSPLATYILPNGVRPNAVQLAYPLTTTDDQLLVLQSDSRLVALDDNLQPDPRFGAHSGTFLIGGYYATGNFRQLGYGPLTARLGSGTADGVLAVDSATNLLLLDASQATMATGATVTWQQPETWAPTVVPQLDGTNPGIACLGVREPITVPPVYELRALRSNGTRRWTTVLGGTPFNDALYGSPGSGQPPHLFVQWGLNTDALLQTSAYSSSGALLWTNTPTNTSANRQPAGMAVSDWNSDGVDDVLHTFGSVRVIDGASGAETLTSATIADYFMPTVYDVDASGVNEVTLHGSSAPARTLTHDLTTAIWTNQQADRPFPYGSIAACNGLPPRLVEASGLYRGRIRITDLSGATAGTAQDLYLASGQIYASSNAATTAGGTLGVLGSTFVHTNLTGAGHPSALVGSTDGWLYAVNPCDGTLDFAYDFQSPVGAVAFGDTDGDGMDDVVVSVADGYLYDLRQDALDAPAWVWDTDPTAGITDSDVDTTTNTASLSARWAPVTGADSYEVAVFGPSGFLTTPIWTSAGAATQITIDVQLTVGTTYFVAVRAVAGGKRSPDVSSDGVTVTAPVPQDAGTDAQADASPGDAGGDATAEASTDAGADAASTDAANDAPGDAAPPNKGTVQGGGCACRTSGPSGNDGLSLALAVLGVALCRRRAGAIRLDGRNARSRARRRCER